MNNEPKNSDMDDYNGEESREKKLEVYLVITLILLTASLYKILIFSI